MFSLFKKMFKKRKPKSYYSFYMKGKWYFGEVGQEKRLDEHRKKSNTIKDKDETHDR